MLKKLIIILNKIKFLNFYKKDINTTFDFTIKMGKFQLYLKLLQTKWFSRPNIAAQLTLLTKRSPQFKSAVKLLRNTIKSNSDM